MAVNLNVEWPQILSAAARLGVDPYFILAVRRAENGKAGQEYGVLSVPAPTYGAQLGVCCTSVRNHIDRYQQAAKSPASAGQVLGSGIERCMYTRGFIRSFADRWAPHGVANDPKDLNHNWFDNVTTLYFRAAEEGFGGTK